MQCAGNITFRSVRANVLVVQMQRVLHNLSVCVCRLRYPACNAHAPYYHVVCPALQYFSTLSHKRHDLRKKVIENKIFVSSFSVTFVWNIFYSRKKWARYDRKCMLVFMYSNRYFWPILIKLEFSRQIFGKSSNIKFHENPSSGSRVVPYGRTDMTKLFEILETRLKTILRYKKY
jgi:hypothetical protein